MNPNINLIDDSGIMFGEKRDGEPTSSRDLVTVSVLLLWNRLSLENFILL